MKGGPFGPWGMYAAYRGSKRIYEGFPKSGILFSGPPMIGIIVFGGLDRGPLILGNYPLFKLMFVALNPKPETLNPNP